MKGNVYDEPSPFTGVRVQLEVLIGQHWTEEEDIFLEGLIIEAQKMCPEARVVSMKPYLNGYEAGNGFVDTVPSNLCGGDINKVGKPVEVSEETLDELVHDWSWRQGANKHFADHLNRVVVAINNDVEQHPMVK